MEPRLSMSKDDLYSQIQVLAAERSRSLGAGQENQALVQAVRAACVQAALDAYEEGGIAGLCEEGRWELALDAVRVLDVTRVLPESESSGAPE
jgi:hypothetical protein